MTQLQIEYFLHVATTKSISKSASDLYVSSPAISKQIALMEQELGLTLFVRGARGMELTHEGQIMFDHYIKARADFNMSIQRAKRINSKQNNTLHLGIMSCWSICGQIMELQRLLRDAPIPTDLVPHAVFDPGNPQRLEKGIFDAALCLGDDLFTTARTTSLHMTALVKVQKMIYFSSRIPTAQKRDAVPADLSDLPLLSFSSEVRPNAQYDNLRLCSSFDFNPKLILKDSLDDVLLSTATGDGFMIGDEWLMQKYLADYATIPLKETHTIYLVWSEHNANPALQLLERYCENEIDWYVP